MPPAGARAEVCLGGRAHPPQRRGEGRAPPTEQLPTEHPPAKPAPPKAASGAVAVHGALAMHGAVKARCALSARCTCSARCARTVVRSRSRRAPTAPCKVRRAAIDDASAQPEPKVACACPSRWPTARLPCWQRRWSSSTTRRPTSSPCGPACTRATAAGAPDGGRSAAAVAGRVPCGLEDLPAGHPRPHAGSRPPAGHTRPPAARPPAAEDIPGRNRPVRGALAAPIHLGGWNR